MVGRPRGRELLTQTEAGNDRAVTLHVRLLQVVQQLTPLADHAQQTLAGMMIVGVFLEMAGQVVDARGQQRDLHFGGTGVAVTLPVPADALRLLGSGPRHLTATHHLARGLQARDFNRVADN